jgi:hypothetical protein
MTDISGKRTNPCGETAGEFGNKDCKHIFSIHFIFLFKSFSL